MYYLLQLILNRKKYEDLEEKHPLQTQQICMHSIGKTILIKDETFRHLC